MSAQARGPRFSFPTKVLAPVLLALVLLPMITLWIVNGYISRQVQEESRQALATADTVFRQSLDLRAKDQLTRFRSAVEEKSFYALAILGRTPARDPQATETIRGFLNDRLKAYGEDYDALVLTSDSGAAPVAVRQHTTVELDDWIALAGPFTRLALSGEAAHGAVQTHGRVGLVVAVPVTDPVSGATVGALTVVNRLGETALQELRSLTGAEILIADGGTVTASTLHQSDLPATLLAPEAAGTPEAGPRILPVAVHGQHYLALAGRFEPGGPQRGFSYLLLSSQEERLRELKATQFTLLAVSLVGVLGSGLAVWFLIRRVTRPLLALRDTAEAVGRGDFTRRIEDFSNDECGEVAEAFNRMTANLQTSRADLEKAVETLKATQAQLIQSEKLSAVGQFVAGIAHELNNPLTTVVGFSELLQNLDVDPKHKSHLDHIARSAMRCHKIVHSLLGFSRQKEPERKLVLLHNVADAVLEIVAYDMRTNNIAVERNYGPDLPPILGDAHQLQQVILNILSNARQAMEGYRRDGRIALATGSADGRVWLRIKDNGPGMRAEVLSRIFDPFYTTKAQGKGTGLGLSLSYGIVQEHQGSIRAESRPGEGAEFILEFPAADLDAVARTGLGAQSATPFRARTPGLNVLAVDDEDSILQLLQEVLRADGHRVVTASSGQAALELIGQQHFDVIVSDWKMPGLNGIHVFEDLQLKDPGSASRMMFMTGDVVNGAFQEFLKKNGRICLPKPFSLGEFRAAVAKLARAG